MSTKWCIKTDMGLYETAYLQLITECEQLSYSFCQEHGEVWLDQYNDYYQMFLQHTLTRFQAHQDDDSDHIVFGTAEDLCAFLLTYG